MAQFEKKNGNLFLILFTDIWPQTQSRESSGLRSNRIDAGSFPLLPEPRTNSEIPTLPLPGRSNPDTSFGSYDFYSHSKTFI